MANIGVTGHRFLAEVDRIKAGVDQALRRIEQAFPGPINVWSSAAEGADRLVAFQVLVRPDSRLIVALPLPKEDYMSDFESTQSRIEFLDLLDSAYEVIQLQPAASRREAYAAAYKHILDNAEVLVAVWDGKAPQGEGGTGDIVRRARDRAMPIAWIHAGNRNPETREAVSLGPEQGTVTFENFPQS